MTVHLNGDTHAVAPVKPVPPHWPNCCTVPGAGAWLGAWLAAGAEAEVAGELGFAGGGAALPPGTAVGTVEG